MFTGIIETQGVVQKVKHEGSNIHYWISSEIASELKIDQSVSHDGVCLTVVDLAPDAYKVTAIQETLHKSQLSSWAVGTKVNLERCMPASGRFDGHIVQGHVDTTGEVTRIEEENGSWRFYIKHPVSDNFMTVKKGSITVNGVSLTVVDSGEDYFSVAIIPYTFEHTGFKHLKVGDKVNLEFDIVGKYIAEMMRRQQQ